MNSETPFAPRTKPRFVDYLKGSNQSLYLARWSLVHAVLMLSATGVFVVFHLLEILLFFSVVSFAFLIFLARNHWTNGGMFGWANTVTAFRLTGILTLPLVYSATGPIFLTGFGLFLLAADGLDGWLARRNHQDSEFGEYFDKETDAFFLLLLCMLAVVYERLGPWILTIGLFRYVFVIVVHTLRPLLRKEQKTGRARIIYILTMVSLLTVFLPYSRFCKPLAAALAAGLALSFAADFMIVFQTPKSE